MLITHILASAALVVASYIDLKIREVPDTLSFGTIGVGVALGILHSATTWSFEPALRMLAGLVLGFVIGAAMYYTGQWGGGDAKLLMGLGALFGASKFYYDFLIAITFSGAIYGILYGIVLACKNRSAFKEAFLQHLRIPIVKRLRIAFQLIVLSALLSAFFLMQNTAYRLVIVVLAAGAYLMFYTILFSKALEVSCMKKRIKTTKLVEGDWVIEEVQLGSTTLKVEGTGITSEQIALLKKQHIKDVLVKEGIPFVPSFLLAYIITLALHNIYGMSLITLFF